MSRFELCFVSFSKLIIAAPYEMVPPPIVADGQMCAKFGSFSILCWQECVILQKRAGSALMIQSFFLQKSIQSISSILAAIPLRNLFHGRDFVASAWTRTANLMSSSF